MTKTKWYAKPIYLLVALALVLSLGIVAVPMAGTVEAATPIYVDASRPDDSGDGTSWATAKKTIGAGISVVDSGGTVHVAAGEYTENIDVNQQVTIIGAGAADTIVTAADNTDHVFEVTAGGVNISGFTVKGVDRYANYKAGIYLGGVENCIISNNTAIENYNGIRLEDSDSNTITENTCNQNYQSGIHLKGSSDNTITDNDCLSSILASGIVLEEWSDGNTIQENTFTLNNMDGIYLSKSSYNTITDNDCSSNGDYGIFLTGMGSGKESSYNTIKRNTCNSNGPGLFGGAGINLQSAASYNTIEENTINTNIGDGIRLGFYQIIDNSIHFNNIVGNTLYGIENTGTTVIDATNNWWGDASGPYHPTSWTYMGSPYGPNYGSGDEVSDYVLYDPWLEALYRPTTPMSSFIIDHAKIDFKKKADDDKIRVQGKLELDLDNGDGVDISEDVIVTVGPLSETITMEEKGKKGEKWEYKRPKGGTGDIKHMTINWKNGKFDIRMDKADLTGVENPVTISVQIGDYLGEDTITMREKKHHWDYKAK